MHRPLSLRVPLLAAVLVVAHPHRLAGGDATFASPLAWKRLAPGASERFAAAAVFDPKRESFLVFGGETHVKEQFDLPDDVWEYKVKDNSWRVLTVNGASPPRRAYHSTAFDETQGDRKSVV